MYVCMYVVYLRWNDIRLMDTLKKLLSIKISSIYFIQPDQQDIYKDEAINLIIKISFSSDIITESIRRWKALAADL